MPTASLLIIEDNRSLAIALSAAAESCGLQTQMAPTLTRARTILNQQSFIGILLDIGLPDGHGLDLINHWQWKQKPEVAVITAHGEIENAIFARKLGIAHFFDKPVNFDELQTFFHSLSQPHILSSPTSPQKTSPFVGAAASMRPVFRQISHACATHLPVVIAGASGVGKSHVANLIQQTSCLSDEHSVLQVSSSLREQPLIDAITTAQGKTLTLESIQTLSPSLQNLLVHTIDKLGKEVPRLLATTDEGGLLKHVEENNFLRDLYLRLQVLEISLPPLKERLDDLPALVDCFLGELGTNTLSRVDQSVFDAFMNYDWPGNLRELRNVMNHAIITSAGTRIISLDHIPSHLISPITRRKTTDEDLEFGLKLWAEQQLESETSYKEINAKLERLLLKILLNRFNGKPSHLASALSINRSTLRKN